MSHRRMHDDEVDTDADLVRRLLASQHPQWADLPIARVASAGTDNAMYRLGDELAVRLPRIGWAVDMVAKEQRWLPVLAPRLRSRYRSRLPPANPRRRFRTRGASSNGSPASSPPSIDSTIPCSARSISPISSALRAVDPTGGPEHRRGGPVRLDDAELRFGLEHLQGEVDGAAVSEAWNRVLATPDYTGPPVWFHGDLASLNLLAREGSLHAVIDWGTCGVGDPAIETIVAWSLFPPDARQAYRDTLRVDDATWERGKGWVLIGVYGIVYYRDTNPALVANIVNAIEAVLDDTP